MQAGASLQPLPVKWDGWGIPGPSRLSEKELEVEVHGAGEGRNRVKTQPSDGGQAHTHSRMAWMAPGDEPSRACSPWNNWGFFPALSWCGPSLANPQSWKNPTFFSAHRRAQCSMAYLTLLPSSLKYHYRGGENVCVSTPLRVGSPTGEARL